MTISVIRWHSFSSLLFCLWLQLPAAAAGGASSAPRLDPYTYMEPTEAEYWAGSATVNAPFRELRLKAADLSRSDFDRHVLRGDVFVVEDLGAEWPMAKWDCDFFRNDPSFRDAEMNQQYAAGGGAPFVAFGSDWMETRTSSGASDQDAPQLAPFYWGIKDVQYDDAHRSPTWKSSMLRKVREHVRLPHFMASANLAGFNTTPEFWFAGAGAGAKAHMDSHVQATISLQLAGTKRWRLGIMQARRAPYLAMIYKDGEVYESSSRWTPQFNLTLKPGEALFFPPGFVHETMNLDEGCAASVTFQFSQPYATQMYRTFLPRTRRTADIHEVWPLLASWACLLGNPPKKGMPYKQARNQALSADGIGRHFRNLDKDQDGEVSMAELSHAFGEDKAQNLLGFHDLDDDGTIRRDEFAEVFGLWAGTVHAVLQDTPKRFRKFQLADMDGDFNIEDLPRKTVNELFQVARDLEAQRAAAPGAAPRSEL